MVVDLMRAFPRRFLKEGWRICTSLFGISRQSINSLKPSDFCTYSQFRVRKFYVLPTQCIYVFCMDLRTNSDYYPKRQ